MCERDQGDVVVPAYADNQRDSNAAAKHVISGQWWCGSPTNARRRQMVCAESSRAMRCSPSSDWLPRESEPQMAPADLAPRQGQVRIGPPAVARHDRVNVGEQLLGVLLVTVRVDRS